MKKQILSEQFKRMQFLAGIITENEMLNTEETYYAICNIGGDFQLPINGKPTRQKIVIKTNSKEELLQKLNTLYRKMTGEQYTPYSMNDLDDSDYIGSYISDDWSTVTKDEEKFNNTVKQLTISDGPLMDYSEYIKIESPEWSKF